MRWSTKSWCSTSGIWQNPYRMGISGLLVRKTCSRTLSNDRASAKSFRMTWMLLSSSHSSSASTTRIYEDRQPLLSSFDSGCRTSSCHWSRRDRLEMSLHSVIASQMYWRRAGILLVSCTAMLDTNLPAWLTSPPPREKKKLAPRRFLSK